jgi:hypothetical protein
MLVAVKQLREQYPTFPSPIRTHSELVLLQNGTEASQASQRAMVVAATGSGSSRSSRRSSWSTPAGQSGGSWSARLSLDGQCTKDMGGRVVTLDWSRYIR